MDKGHYCVSATTTDSAHEHSQPFTTPRQWRRGVLQATTGELLPTFCKGSSTLFPNEKIDSIRERGGGVILNYIKLINTVLSQTF